MRASYELTQRFTAEFSIRPFLIRYRDDCLAVLMEWTRDSNPHVRRLCSEGTRSRLPWGIRLPEFQRDPACTIPLLEMLKDDPELYVRRSVANHIGDILKEDCEIGYSLCERWLREATHRSFPDALRAARRWIVRHAVRLPARRNDADAIRLRKLAK